MTARVLYWNNIPSPYMVERFNVIARRANVDLHVCFNERLQPDRSWDVDESRWAFPYSYLQRSRLAGLRLPLPQLRRLQPDLLITLYENLSFVSGALLAKQQGAKVALHAMKVFDTWRPVRRHRELAKHWLFPRVDAFHVPGADAAAYIRQYGARPGRIWAFPEPVDVQHFASGARQARQDSDARRRLGLTGCVYLCVGRLWSGKGIDYLLDAYARLTAEGVSASLVLAGDGVDEARYRAQAAGLPNVVFPGFVQKPGLPRWYGLADVLVFPTLGDPYGHVVQEAMAAGLPVIATENAGEIRERVLDGETGFVVPAADSDALLDGMRRLALDPERRCRMGERGYERIRPRTIEWWAGEFEAIVQCIVGGVEQATRVSEP
jgi:glycosyltransferase involved in cell wall biosynthesis